MEEEINEECGSKSGRMRLILSKGWMVGKKIMITGVAISSAPIVLPPLIVFSTIVFVFAVPFSFIFASYVCADKVMSKLLSNPNVDISLMDDKDDGNDEFDEKGGGEKMDWEFEELVEDAKVSLESRIELIGDEEGGQKRPIEVDDGNRAMEEMGYENDYVVEEEECPVQEVDDSIENEVKPVTNAEEPIMDIGDGSNVYYSEIRGLDEEERYLVGEERGVADESGYAEVTEDMSKTEDIPGEMYEITKEIGNEGNVDNLEQQVKQTEEAAGYEGDIDSLEEEERHVMPKEGEVVEENGHEENMAKTFKEDDKLSEETYEITSGMGNEGFVDNMGQQAKQTEETTGVLEEMGEEKKGIKPFEDEKPAERTYEMTGERVDNGVVSSLEPQVVPIKEPMGTVEVTEEEEERLNKLPADEQVMPVKQTETSAGQRGHDEYGASIIQDEEKSLEGTYQEKIDRENLNNVAQQVKQTVETTGFLEEMQKEGNRDKPIEKDEKRAEDDEQRVIPIKEKIVNLQEARDEEVFNKLLDKEVMRVKQVERLVGGDEENGDVVIQEEVKPSEGTYQDMGEQEIINNIVQQVNIIEETAEVLEENLEDKNLVIIIEDEEKTLEETYLVSGEGVEIGTVNNIEQQLIEETAEVLEETLEDKNLVIIIEDEEKPLEETYLVSGEGVEIGSVGNIEQQLKQIDESMKILEDIREEGDFDKVLAEVATPTMERSVENGRDERHLDIIVEEENPIVNAKVNADIMIKEKKIPAIDVKQSRVPLTREALIEMADEFGVCLFYDETTPASEVYTYEADNMLSGHDLNSNTKNVRSEQESFFEDQQSSNRTRGTETEVYTTTDAVSPEEDKHVATKPGSEKETTYLSKEVLLDEEKICEKIDSLRKIVGYKADHQPTCIDELKALYLFTGVEPPDAFKDISDLAEVNDKLRILMAIVSVK
ncbi:hypothetical protein GIB67_028816 [Kingdonia uniflora]|uniref:Uncharacterized protein n=1 Tax=Kingdonia uniflora TaxID=39325 RepID=A0A7J7LT25_9MAGN|nr:hypothetical protein GIB67_028816 [Kingdonia uniflora]